MRNPRLWWLLTVLAVLVALFVSATIQRAIDHHNAARELYRTQLLTTFWRILDEEHRQLNLPLAQRNAAALDDVAASITNDTGVNGEGTLQVSLGSGSIAAHQAAFSVTVSSPYGSTTVAVWSVIFTSKSSTSSDDGACVLSSTLLGSGRATTDLSLGGNEYVSYCLPSLWRGAITPTNPNLGQAGIDPSGA